MADIGDWLQNVDANSSFAMDGALAFEAQVLKDAYAEWSRWGAIPARSQFTPRSSKAFLGNLVIFERQGSTFRIRLMGTRISNVIGEMQGKLVEEGLPSDVAARWNAVLGEVIASGRPMRAVKTVAFNDLHYLGAEILLAPLRDSRDEVTMVFAVAAFRSGVAPGRRLGDLIAAST